MLTKHSVDPDGSKGREAAGEENTSPLAQDEGATAGEHDLQEQLGAQPHHTSTPQESNYYKQQPVQLDHHHHCLKATPSRREQRWSIAAAENI
jgi:hypothetical protein